MKNWWTAAELAAGALPGLPATERGVRKIADRQGWRRQQRAGRGGGFEFHVEALPLAARAKLLVSAVAETPAAPAETRSEDLWAVFDRKPASTKAEAERRHKAVIAVENLISSGVGKVAAIKQVAAQTSDGASTIRRWFDMVEDKPRSDWVPLLAPAWCGRTSTAECSPQAWDCFKADYLREEEPAAEACYERLQRVAAEKGWTVPSLKTLMRRLERELSPAQITLARKGKNALKRLFPAQRRDHAAFAAMEAVNADGHTFDVFVRFPDGTVGRPCMVAVQDIFSGKFVGYRLGETENADLVRLAFGDAFAAYGPADHVYLDNGRGFASKWITGGTPNRFRFKVKAEDPEGVLTRCGCTIHWTTPFHGQAKPIERAFRDLCESIAKHPKCSGAYTGNSPGNKPANYGSKQLDYAEFAALVAEEMRRHNARQGRRSDVCAGRSFDEAFAESYARAALPRRLTAEQQRMFLLAAENRFAARGSGQVEILGHRYWTERLVEVQARRVTVRFDPSDLSLPVHVYTLDGRFVATAERVEKAAFNDAEAAKKHNRLRRGWMRAQKEQLDLERQMDAMQVAALLPTSAPGPAPEAPPVVRGVFGNTALKLEGASPAPAEDRDAQFSRAVELLRQQKKRGL